MNLGIAPGGQATSLAPVGRLVHDPIAVARQRARQPVRGFPARTVLPAHPVPSGAMACPTEIERLVVIRVPAEAGRGNGYGRAAEFQRAATVPPANASFHPIPTRTALGPCGRDRTSQSFPRM